MSKTDRIITDTQEKINILKSMDIVRLGLVDNGLAYIVPVNFVYDNGCIYFHTGLRGRKIPLLKSSKLISFQADTYDGLKIADTACGHSSYFHSVYGEGEPVFLTGSEEKCEILDLLMEKFTGKKWGEFSSSVLKITEVVCIKITKLEAVVHKNKEDNK